MDNKFLEIGKIVKTIGLQGEVKLLLEPRIKYQEAVHPQRLFIKKAGVWQPLEVVYFQVQPGVLLLKFENYESATKANSLREQKIYALKTETCFSEQPLWTDYQVKIDSRLYLVLETWNNGHYDLVKIQIQKPLWIPLTKPYLVKVDEAKKILEIELGGLE